MKKFLIPDAFKHVRLQNTFNRWKVHQILPRTVDDACCLVECINYQKVMCIQLINFLRDLAKFLKNAFLQDSRNTTLAKFLQEMRKCCKIVARILQDLLSNSSILQDMYFLQKFCKNCIDCKNFARFLQKLFFL